MKLVNLVQSSPEWLVHRTRHDNASEAPVIMGDSRYCTREELMRVRATGDEREITAFQQKLYDRGHASEAAHRPNAEKAVGEDLYPAVGVSEVLERFSASYDGLVMDGSKSWEHKLWNEDLAAQIRAKELTDPHYFWQLEHQLANADGELKSIIFSCGDEHGDRFLWMEYFPVAGRQERLLAGWKQFREDLANYQPIVDAPKPLAKALKALPSLTIELSGRVESSNLALYRESALEFIDSINTNLVTDEDFADAEGAVKFLAEAEAKIKLVKSAALGQTASIDELFRSLDEIDERMSKKRLAIEKLVQNRKDAIKLDLRGTAENALKAHIAALNKRLSRVQLPPVTAKFAEAMKGRRSLTGLREGLDKELVRLKLDTSAQADKMSANLATLDGLAGEQYKGLFTRDLQQLVLKDEDALVAIARQRIADEDARAEREQQRILEQDRQRREREEAAKRPVEPPAPPAQKDTPAPRPAGAAHVSARDVERSIPVAAKPPAESRTPAPAANEAREPRARPTDADIIATLAIYYSAEPMQVVEWLREMDLEEPTLPASRAA